jgi:hypothetical protein
MPAKTGRMGRFRAGAANPAFKFPDPVTRAQAPVQCFVSLKTWGGYPPWRRRLAAENAEKDNGGQPHNQTLTKH